MHRLIDGLDGVGQNIKMQYSTKKNKPLSKAIKKAVKKWYAEKKDFDPKWRTSKNGGFEFQSSPIIGHYTQVVWADTYKVTIKMNKVKKYVKKVVCTIKIIAAYFAFFYL